MTDDDEFVARAGQLWAWTDQAIDAGRCASLTGATLVFHIGGTWWMAALLVLAFMAVTWVAVERERERLFPDDGAPGADPA